MWANCPQRAHKDSGVERSDEDADRKSAESGAGRKLRDGSGVAGRDQAVGKSTGGIEMKFQNLMASAGEWLRGEGPHHQIVVSSRVRLARNLRNRAFPGMGEEGGAHADSGVDQAARGRAARNAGAIFGIASGSCRRWKNRCWWSAI